MRRILGNCRSIYTDQRHDTVYALATGPIVQAGVAILRISGPHAKYCVEKFLTNNISSQILPNPRHAALRKLFCPMTGELLDRALVLWFPGPNSFTGEDSAEFHVHGSRAVISGIIQSLDKLNLNNVMHNFGQVPMKFRLATHGEFSRRAFENGRMNLTEVEGLADLIAADTSVQRHQALQQMEGHLTKFFERWRGELIKYLAHTEAVIDFGDDDRESDVSDAVMWTISPQVRRLRDELVMHLSDGRRGEIIREGVRIALIGPPNAGKSSLLNALARRPAAIVSPIAGTTRDVVDVRLDIAGVACVVSDTAGLRELPSDDTDKAGVADGRGSDRCDAVEREGMRRAREVLNKAHVQLFLCDSNDRKSQEAMYDLLDNHLSFPVSAPTSSVSSALSSSPASSSISLAVEAAAPASEVLVVRNKCDLVAASGDSVIKSVLREGHSHTPPQVPEYSISCNTGQGLAELEIALHKHIQQYLTHTTSLSSTPSSDGLMITRARHREHVQQAVQHLDKFLSNTLLMDAAAEELRLAMWELGRVTGSVHVDELLDVIFRDFCIGK